MPILHDGADVFMYQDSTIALLLDLRRGSRPVRCFLAMTPEVDDDDIPLGQRALCHPCCLSYMGICSCDAVRGFV